MGVDGQVWVIVCLVEIVVGGVGVMVLWCYGVVYWVKVFLLVVVEIVGMWIVCLYFGFNYCFEEWIIVWFWCCYVYWVIVVVVVVRFDIVGFCFLVVGQVVEIVLVFQIWFFGLVVQIYCVIVNVVYVVDQ